MSMSDCLHIITKYGRRFIYSSRHFILCVNIMVSATLMLYHHYPHFIILIFLAGFFLLLYYYIHISFILYIITD